MIKDYNFFSKKIKNPDFKMHTKFKIDALSLLYT